VYDCRRARGRYPNLFREGHVSRGHEVPSPFPFLSPCPTTTATRTVVKNKRWHASTVQYPAGHRLSPVVHSAGTLLRPVWWRSWWIWAWALNRINSK